MDSSGIQSSRETTGNVQPNLFLIKIRDFKVARFSDRFEALVEALSLRTLAAFRSSTDKQKQAEDTLLAALGLADWEPPEPLSYTARASDAFAAGRLDAEFFQPRLKSLINKLEEAAGDFRLVALGAYSEPLKYGSSEKLEYADKGMRIPVKPATQSGESGHPVGAKRRWGFHDVSGGRFESM